MSIWMWTLIEGLIMTMSYRKMLSLLSLSVLLSFAAEGQYYYQDILKTETLNLQLKQQAEEGVQSIQVHSFDDKNQPISDFVYEEEWSDKDHKIVRRSRTSAAEQNLFTSYYDAEKRITHTIDSSQSNIAHTYMYYSDEGRMDSVKIKAYTIVGNERSVLLRPMADTTVELRSYTYDAQGNLEKMTRKKGGNVYSTVIFQTDSLGHVVKEKEDRKEAPTYYYRYELGNLVGIFHYNPGSDRVRPDYLFEYDASGVKTKETVIMANTKAYIEWRFSYGENGLIEKQTGYDKEGQRVAVLVFRYDYGSKN